MGSKGSKKKQREPMQALCSELPVAMETTAPSYKNLPKSLEMELRMVSLGDRMPAPC